MEPRIIHHDHTGIFQLFKQKILNPCIDQSRVARAVKNNRREPFIPALRHNQINIFSVIARYIALYFLPARRPAMRTIGVFLKPALIKVNDVFFAVAFKEAAQAGKIRSPLPITSLGISTRFFLRCSWNEVRTKWRLCGLQNERLVHKALHQGDLARGVSMQTCPACVDANHELSGEGLRSCASGKSYCGIF
nr:hypothetical protein [Nitrosococcus oceani]